MLSKEEVRRIQKRHSFFRSTTFASKLFLKLTQSQVNPLISAVSVLKFEPSNRTKKDIEQTLPWLFSLQPFLQFITYKEDIQQYEQILIYFAMVLYYQYLKPNFIFKHLGDKPNHFFLIMTGKIIELHLTFAKQHLTEQEYLTHLIKLSILHETHLCSRIISLNKECLNFKGNSLQSYITQHTKYNYNDLCTYAHKSLLQYGINGNCYKDVIPNIETYMKVIECDRYCNGNDDRKSYWIGGFIKTRTLSDGDYIGDLICWNNNAKLNSDNYAYVVSEQTDMGYINKKEHANEEIFKIIARRMQRIFTTIQKTYYILQNIPSAIFVNVYAHLITYKQIKKGEKLFMQNSSYNGVYLLSFGEYEISTYRSYDELDGLIIQLQTSLDGYNEYISPLQTEKLPVNTISGNILKGGSTKDKRKIIICKYNNKEVIGLNEYYNTKNHLYNFTVECLSEVGFYYYISKECFTYMIHRERLLKESIMQLVELKVKYFIGTIRKYKESYINNINIRRNENKQTFLQPIDGNTLWKRKRNLFLNVTNSERITLRNDTRKTYGAVKLMKTPVNGMRGILFRKGMSNDTITYNGMNGDMNKTITGVNKFISNGYCGCVNSMYSRNSNLPIINTNVNRSDGNIRRILKHI